MRKNRQSAAKCAFQVMLTMALGVVSTSCNKSDSAKTGDASTTALSAAKTYTIAVIPKGTTHAYWKNVQAGAQKAADELGVTMIWKGPLLENDRAQQISIVEQFLSQGVNAIEIAPLDNVALKRPVDQAMAAHVPVVIIDSALQGDAGTDFVSFVATDNEKGGEMAGTELARELGGKGKVVMLRYGEGSASTLDREAGFMKVMDQTPGIQVLVKNRFAGPTMADAKNSAMQLSDQLAHADGVFASNESASTGMLLALRQLSLAGKVKFVTFDISDMIIDGLKKGEINASVAQNPNKMAYLGMQQAVNALKGLPVTPKIDSGAALITLQNMNDPANADFIAQ